MGIVGRDAVALGFLGMVGLLGGDSGPSLWEGHSRGLGGVTTTCSIKEENVIGSAAQPLERRFSIATHSELPPNPLVPNLWRLVRTPAPGVQSPTERRALATIPEELTEFLARLRLTLPQLNLPVHFAKIEYGRDRG